MTTQISKDISDYIIEKSISSSVIHIHWFGGEPLMKFDSIKLISLKIIDFSKKNSKELRFHLTTNGLLLKKYYKELQSVNISSLQVTFDGPSHIHNRIRNNSFEQIINAINIIDENCLILIRCNVAKSWIKEIPFLIDELSASLKRKNVEIYLHFLYEEMESEWIKEFAYFEIEMIDYIFNKNLIYSFNYKPKLLPCSAHRFNSLMIDCNGNLKKCDHEFGKNTSYGTIYTGVTDLIGFKKWLSYSIDSNSKCRKCQIFSICQGYCISKLLNGACPPRKYNYKAYLKRAYMHKPINESLEYNQNCKI